MLSVKEEIEKKIKFLKLGKQLGNIRQAAKLMGYTTATYYKLKKIYDLNGEEGLYQHIRRRSRLIKEVENEVFKLVMLFPKFSAARISKELKLRNIKISTGSIHTILKKHNLNTTKQRLEKIKNK